MVLLSGIAVLERSDINEIRPFAGAEAIHAILNQVVRPHDMASRIKLLELLDKLVTDVPVWKLCCNMEPEAAVVSYKAMSGMRKGE